MTDEDKTPGPADQSPGHNSQATPEDLADLKVTMERLPTVDQLIAMLQAENADQLGRVDGLIAKGAEFLFIDDDAKDSEATEFLVKLRARYKGSEADRVARKSPFDDLAGAVQAFFKTRILDPLGAAPSNAREEFDPVTANQWGMGVRITMAQTIYKRRKAARELAAREAAAAAARKVEADAKAKRDKEEADRKAAADKAAKEAKDKADAEAKVRKDAADKAAAEALALAEAAARKRNATNKEAADKAAAQAAAIAAKAKAEQEEADRVANAEQEERERKAQQDQEEADAKALAEENRIAEERSKLEEASAATTADLSRSRGGKGGVSSLREFVDFRDLKRELLAEFLVPGAPISPSILLLLPFITDAALEKAVKDYEKANKATVLAGIKNGRQPVHGVVYFMNNKTAGRA